MNEKFLEILKYLRMNNLIANWDEYIKLEEQDNYSNVKLLKYIFEEEYKIKKENSRKLRINKAHIPEKFVIETFPFDRQPNLNKKKLLSIYDDFGYMRKKQNIIFIGPTGCGKTGLATSFLIQAINKEYTGRYILFCELINTLHKSIADHSEENVIKKFAAYDCLHIDEMVYVETDPAQIGLFFILLHKRHKKRTTLC